MFKSFPRLNTKIKLLRILIIQIQQIRFEITTPFTYSQKSFTFETSLTTFNPGRRRRKNEKVTITNYHCNLEHLLPER